MTGFTLLELFEMGGVLMWPLLLFSIIAVAITLERGIYLLYHNLSLGDLKEKVEAAIKNNNLDEAKTYLETKVKRRMGARIFLSLIKRAGHSEQRMEKAVEAEALSCISSLENGFNFLTALGSISPLTGFLGTVTGMIGAFRSIAEAADVNAQIVASGIYEALVTTVFGLVIAIIAMSAHSLFTHVVDKFAGEVEAACSELIIAISEMEVSRNSKSNGIDHEN
jgi:biopolymer transport protein ExbB